MFILDSDEKKNRELKMGDSRKFAAGFYTEVGMQQGWSKTFAPTLSDSSAVYGLSLAAGLVTSYLFF